MQAAKRLVSISIVPFSIGMGCSFPTPDRYKEIQDALAAKGIKATVKAADGTGGQWYLHLFAAKQPDLNWENPQVRTEFEDVLKFWLERGVDGFRVDVANALIKAAGLPDWDEPLHILGDADGVPHDHHGKKPPMWDQEGVHEIYRAWRQILNSYNPIDAAGYSQDSDRILCAEAWVDSPERLARYVRQDEMHQAFNFEFLQA